MSGHLNIAISDLLVQIDAYCDTRGIKPTTFGQRALKDRNFVERLRSGGRCWPETISKVERYMLENPAVAKPERSKAIKSVSSVDPEKDRRVPNRSLHMGTDAHAATGTDAER